MLFTLDPRPAQAQLAAARAQAELAKGDMSRAEALLKEQAISREEYESRKAAYLVAEAAVRSRALDVEFTRVTAPATGVVSNRRVDPGNLIAGGQSGATLLTTIVAVDPIYFTFDVSESDFLRYARMANVRDNASRDSGTLVEVRLSDEAKWDRKGKVNFLDNAVNARSATIRGRAVFDNKDQFLTPGVFGRLRFYAGEADALLVPDAVIASDQAHKVVLTVGPENKVVPKIVELGPLSEGLRVIRAGLTAQDKVIIGGNANPMVRPGVAVTPQPGEIKVATTN